MLNSEIKRIAVVGAGRVGSMFIKEILNSEYLLHLVIDEDQSVLDRIKSEIPELASISECRTDISECQVILLTVQDRFIQKVCTELLDQGLISSGTIVVHCSGSMPIQILNGVYSSKAFPCVIHPLLSFATDAFRSMSFKDVIVCIEAAESINSQVCAFVQGLGAVPVTIPEDRTRYHIASVFASNYITLLMYIAENLYESAGLDRPIAEKIVCQLAQSVVKNIDQSSFENALSGPLARKDFTVIDAHLQELNSMPPEIRNLYIQHLKSLLYFLGENNRLNSKEISQIQYLFKK